MGQALRNIVRGSDQMATGNTDRPNKFQSRLPKFSIKKLLQRPRKEKASKEGQIMDLADLPQLREADSHPDAPARRPLFVETDLGTPLAAKIKPFEEEVPVSEPLPLQSDEVVPADSTVGPSSKSDSAEDTPGLSEEISSKSTGTAQHAEQPEDSASSWQPKAQPAKPDPTEEKMPKIPEDLSNLSIAQLADRLEKGLKRLEELSHSNYSSVAQATTGAHIADAREINNNAASTQEALFAVPPLKSVDGNKDDQSAYNQVDSRQANMDAALKAALGTLEKMTAQR